MSRREETLLEVKRVYRLVSEFEELFNKKLSIYHRLTKKEKNEYNSRNIGQGFIRLIISAIFTYFLGKKITVAVGTVPGEGVSGETILAGIVVFPIIFAIFWFIVKAVFIAVGNMQVKKYNEEVREYNERIKPEINKEWEPLTSEMAEIVNRYGDVVPSDYRTSTALSVFVKYLENYRVDDIKECINLFEHEKQLREHAQLLQKHNDELRFFSNSVTSSVQSLEDTIIHLNYVNSKNSR